MPPPAGPAPPVDVIVAAWLPTPHDYVFRASEHRLARLRHGLRAGPDALRSPCLAFVIRHPTAGPVLVDTGLHPDALISVAADYGFPMRLLFGGMEPEPLAFDAQLRRLEIEPADVAQVVMTHLHVDHTSGMRLLPDATFTATRQEWDATRGRLAAGRGYVARHLPPASRMRLLDIEGDGVPHGPFARTIDLLGDGSIRLVSTPGHTAGHLSVLVELPERPTVLLVGDAAYTLRSIEEERLPMLTHDDDASRRTLHALRQFARDRPDAIVVPTHDPDAWRALAAGATASRSA